MSEKELSKEALKSPPETGRVAQLFTSTQIALNFGSEQGSTVGLRYRIIYAVQVMDPDTNKVLDTVEYTKGLVEVTSVFRNISIASPPEVDVRRQINMSLFGSSYETQKIRPALNVDRKQLVVPEGSLDIRVGDTVKLVRE